MRWLNSALIIVLLVFGGLGEIRAKAAPSPSTIFSPSLYGVPKNLGGYNVLAVLTEENYGCMPPGENILVLQTNEQTLEKATRLFQKEKVKQDLYRNKLVAYANWVWSVVGPGINPDEYLRELQETSQSNKVGGCSTFSMASPTAVNLSSQADTANNGYAIVQDTDVANYTDVSAQSAILIAPRIGSNQDQTSGYSGFLNNVRTDTNFFLQVGFGFWNSGAKVIWADTSTGLYNQSFTTPVPYNAGNPYYTTITFTAGVWQMCAGDYNHIDTQYQCYLDPIATGTHLKSDINTSIFVENANKKPTWSNGFDNPFKAFDAELYRNGVGQQWGSEKFLLVNGCPQSAFIPPKTVISGSLINGGTIYFNTSKVPLYCYNAILGHK